jgi:hypothetical protein
VPRRPKGPRKSKLKEASDVGIEACIVVLKSYKKLFMKQARESKVAGVKQESALLIHVEGLNETLKNVFSARADNNAKAHAILANKHNVLGSLSKAQKVELLWNLLDIEPPKEPKP